jgi:hypothetical protein
MMSSITDFANKTGSLGRFFFLVLLARGGMVRLWHTFWRLSERWIPAWTRSN